MQSFIILPFLFGIFLSFDSFICIFQKGLFRKIHFAQLWLDKHQQVSYVLKVLVLHPSRWPLTLRISLSTPSRTHCTCEGLSCTAWKMTFKYLGKITRILCRRHNTQLLLKQNNQHPIITWQFQEQGGHLGLGHRGGNRWRAAPGRKMFQIWTGLCYRARESCNQGFHANLWHGERRWPLGP